MLGPLTVLRATSACAQDRTNPQTHQLCLVFRAMTRFHFWKKAFMIPQNLLMDWNVTKGWIWFVHMKTTVCFWRIHWGMCMLQKSIRKGDIFVSRSQLPQFLIQQEAELIICFWQRAEVCCYSKSIHSLKLYQLYVRSYWSKKMLNVFAIVSWILNNLKFTITRLHL